jgi:hypothetical protein
MPLAKVMVKATGTVAVMATEKATATYCDVYVNGGCNGDSDGEGVCNGKGDGNDEGNSYCNNYGNSGGSGGSSKGEGEGKGKGDGNGNGEGNCGSLTPRRTHCLGGGVLWGGSFGLWEGWESRDEWILPSSDEGFGGLRYVHVNSYIDKGVFDINTTPCSRIGR